LLRAAALNVQSGSDDLCVRTDENPRFLFFAGFPAGERERLNFSKKVAYSHFFNTQSSPEGLLWERL